MAKSPLANTPANLTTSAQIHTSQELGEFIKQYRTSQNMLQADIVGLANTGNRFIVDLEKGKPTLQLQKVLDVLDLIGLEVIVRRKGTK
ncbi:MAG TPA: transcriptional regulator [Burkholderiaceae bacterium]|jgi:y4mF family transcriptional regulator